MKSITQEQVDKKGTLILVPTHSGIEKVKYLPVEFKGFEEFKFGVHYEWDYPIIFELSTGRSFASENISKFDVVYKYCFNLLKHTGTINFKRLIKKPVKINN